VRDLTRLAQWLSTFQISARSAEPLSLFVDGARFILESGATHPKKQGRTDVDVAKTVC
jgi:hypothetical protein